MSSPCTEETAIAGMQHRRGNGTNRAERQRHWQDQVPRLRTEEALENLGLDIVPTEFLGEVGYFITGKKIYPILKRLREKFPEVPFACIRDFQGVIGCTGNFLPKHETATLEAVTEYLENWGFKVEIYDE